MSQVTVYTTEPCGYCRVAKALLNKRGIAFEEINLAKDPEGRAELVRRTREWPAVSLGASPRAAVGLMLASKAIAAMDGRDFVVPDDVKDAAAPVMRHRIVVKPEADLEGITSDQVVEDVIRTIEVPQ